MGRFVLPIDDRDLDLLAVWIAHTHLVDVTYTTPRLCIDSPLPESGKTTVLEHMSRLCFQPVFVASLSSPAMLARMLDAGPRTILLDETDKNLKPDREGVGDLLAVLNTGYKRGGTRPVLMPSKDGAWSVREMPTFAPLAMAGLSTQLPDDTASRTITVNLLPDAEGVAEDSDWEVIETDAHALRDQIVTWAAAMAEQVRADRQPELPPGTVGRAREKWRPLMRVAVAAGGRWPEAVTELILRDLDDHAADKEEGLMRERPTLVLLRDLAAVWPVGQPHVRTADLITALSAHNPDAWSGLGSGRTLTPQGMGRMLSRGFRIRSSKDAHDRRGYRYADLVAAWRRTRIQPPPPPHVTVETVGAVETVVA
jgi:hypothetical protein